MTLPPVLPDPTADLSHVEMAVSTLRALAKAMDVASDQDMVDATSLLARIKEALTRAEVARKVLVGPLNAHVKMINGQFTAVTAPLAESERVVKQKMGVYIEAQERARREEAQRRFREEQERALDQIVDLDAAGEEVAAEVALSFAAAATAAEPERIEPTRTESGEALSVRKIWAFEVVDFRALSDEYKSANDLMIRSAIRSGVREIPGLRIFQQNSLALKGTK